MEGGVFPQCSECSDHCFVREARARRSPICLTLVTCIMHPFPIHIDIVLRRPPSCAVVITACSKCSKLIGAAHLRANSMDSC